MKNKAMALSLAAMLGTNLMAADAQSDLAKLQKKVANLEKKINKVKAHDANDNIKWSADFRSSVDNIQYTLADNTVKKNNALLSNRLLLNLKYKPEGKVSFYSILSYNKTFGANVVTPSNYASFDWITNESASNDSSLKVKEAFWLYANDTFLGLDMPWTASVGRRPSTDGLGASYREDQNPKSAIASTVNVEFDGVSLRWNLDGYIPLEGSWFKLCMGRGTTNADSKLATSGVDYAANSAFTADSNMVGVIFVPYDNGQYSLWTNYAQANHLLGYSSADMAKYMDGKSVAFSDVGDINISTIMFKAEGIGDEISDYLDNTILFISYSASQTKPLSGENMLGSTDAKIGNSVLFGVQMPCPITEDGKLGIEVNHGDKYWRSMTYGEDTMAGSKIAVRGTAGEVYWIKPLSKSLSMNLRATYIKYDYTGSNTFFGADGTPMSIADAKAAGMNPAQKVTDVRAYIRYRF